MSSQMRKSSIFAAKLAKEMKTRNISSERMAEHTGVPKEEILRLMKHAMTQEEIQPFVDACREIKQTKNWHKTMRVYVDLPENLYEMLESTGNMSGKVNEILVRFLEKCHDLDL